MNKYQQRIIVQEGDDSTVQNAANRLRKKYPDSSVIVKRDLSGKLQLSEGMNNINGKVKIEFVGHGSDAHSSEPKTVGDRTLKQIAHDIKSIKEVALDKGADITKVSLVSCESGVCKGDNTSAAKQLEKELNEQGINPRKVKGYGTRIDVSPKGKKIAVSDGGLMPHEKKTETDNLNPNIGSDETSFSDKEPLIRRNGFEFNINSMIKKVNKDPFYAAARLPRYQTVGIGRKTSPFEQWRDQRRDKIERFNSKQQSINNSDGSHDLEWSKLKTKEFIPNILEISDEKYRNMVAGWILSGAPYAVNSVVSSSLNPISYIPFAGALAQAVSIPSGVISASTSVLAKYFAKAADDSSTVMKASGRQVLMPEIADALSAGESNKKLGERINFMSIELDNLDDIDNSNFDDIIGELRMIRDSQKMTSERMKYGMTGNVAGVPNAALSFGVSTSLGLLGVPSIAATTLNATYGWATGSGLSEAAQQDYGIRLRMKHSKLDPEQPFQARGFYMSGTQNKLAVIKSMTDNSILRNQIRIDDLNKKKHFFEKLQKEGTDAISNKKLSKLIKLMDNSFLLERAYNKKIDETQGYVEVQSEKYKKLNSKYIIESARLGSEILKLESDIVIDLPKRGSDYVKTSSIIEDYRNKIDKRTNKILLNTKDSELVGGVLKGINDPSNLLSGDPGAYEVEMLAELTPGSKIYELIDDPKNSYKRTIDRISRKHSPVGKVFKVIGQVFDKISESGASSEKTSHLFSLGAAAYVDSFRTYSTLNFSYSYNIVENRKISIIPKNIGFNRMVEAVPGALLTNTVSSGLKFSSGGDLNKIGTSSSSTVGAVANQYGIAHNVYVDKSPSVKQALKNLFTSPLRLVKHSQGVKSMDNLVSKVDEKMKELSLQKQQESIDMTSQVPSENEPLLSGLQYSSAMKKLESSKEKKTKKEDAIKHSISKKKNEDRRPLL
jgi:hypothetical protein